MGSADTNANGLPSPTLTNPDMILTHNDHSATNITWEPSMLYNLPMLHGKSSATSLKVPLCGELHPHDQLKTKGAPKKSSDTQGVDDKAVAANRESKEKVDVVRQMAADIRPGFEPTHGWDNDTSDTVMNWPVIGNIDHRMTTKGRETTTDQDFDVFRGTEGHGYGIGSRNSFFEIEDENDPTSHAALSKKAEDILANAKRRLTEMETNLLRARHSLGVKRSASMSSIRKRSDSYYSQNLGGHRGREGGPPSPAKHRQLDSLSSSGSTMGHSRVFSETSVPSSLQTTALEQEKGQDSERASSAMGSSQSRAGFPEYDDDHNKDTLRNRYRSRITGTESFNGRRNITLGALKEDGPAPAFFGPKNIREFPPGKDQLWSKGHDQMSASGLTKSSSNGLTRSRSTVQMRELRDQMQDLRGKISSLKDRAREDSLRRRSLQSLRIPSPFTAAEQWYTGADVYRHDGVRKEPNSGPAKDAEEFLRMKAEPKQDLSIETVLSNDCEPQDTVETFDAKLSPESQEGNWFHDQLDSSAPLIKDHVRVREGLAVVEEVSETESFSDEEEYHESSPARKGERHEDRADAFDYEHFYLNSGMGSFSRKNLGKRDSGASTDSAETTKPVASTQQSFDHDEEGSPVTGGEARDSDLIPEAEKAKSAISKVFSHARQSSIDSVSTVATFATATQGEEKHVEDQEDDMDQVPPMAGSWHADYTVDPQNHNFGHNHNNTIKKTDGLSSQIEYNERPQVNGNSLPTSPTGSFPSVYTSPLLSPSALGSDLQDSNRKLDGHNDDGVQLCEIDRTLIEKLLGSLMTVSTHLHSGDKEQGNYENKVWRRRLDTARRVLDGEMDGDMC